MPVVKGPFVNMPSVLKMTAMMVLVLALAAGLSACGKRGEPYRPSEVTTPTS